MIFFGRKICSLLYAIVVLHLDLIHCEVNPLNILGVFPYEGRSQFSTFKYYLQTLAERGHNVTVISYFPRIDPIENYYDINLNSEKIVHSHFSTDRSYSSVFELMDFVVSTGNEGCKRLLRNQNVQNLWRSNKKFDLIIVQHFNSDCGMGLAYKLGAPVTPVIGIISHEIMPWHYSRFGIPFNPSFSTFILTPGIQPTLYERLEKTILYVIFLLKYRIKQCVDQKTMESYFKDIPPIEDLSREMKLMLVAQNFILTGTRILPANIIEVGGFHIMPPKRLPDDLQKFIDESQHGVIYISFGTLLKGNTVLKGKLDAVLSALSELPQRVIWKWDEKNLPGSRENIFVSDWLPQNDILAHPNVVAFFSHGGLSGTTESVYYGVPMVVMPITADQPINAEAVEERGFGVQLELSQLTKEILLEKFRSVLCSEFRERVKQLSRAFQERPSPPLETAIFWTEYAARHHNLTFRSYSADVPLYQYLCMDVIFILTMAILTVSLLLKKIIGVLFYFVKLFFGHYKSKYE